MSAERSRQREFLIMAGQITLAAWLVAFGAAWAAGVAAFKQDADGAIHLVLGRAGSRDDVVVASATPRRAAGAASVIGTLAALTRVRR